MLLYALHTPAVADSWNHRKVYAFASVQRYVNCLRQSKELAPITQDEALRYNSLAHLYVGENGDEKGFAPDLVHIHDNAIRDNWDGSFKEVQLVECIADERYHPEPRLRVRR